MAVALVSLTAFGCTTIRAPASAIAPAIPIEDGRPAPQVELWLESGRPIEPREAERARADVNAALRAALAQRPPGEGDQLLVVRAQGVSRTASQRSNQKAAVAGIVIGAVAVVAVVVLAVVAGKGSGGGKGGGGAAKAGGRPGGWATGAGGHAAGAVRPSPPGAGHVRPAPLPRPPRPGTGAVAGWRPSHRPPPHTSVWIGWSAEVQVPWQPVEVVELEPVPVPDRQPPWAWEPAPLESLAAAPEPTEQAEADTIWLAPLPPLDVDERGFFAGDLLRLELTLVDRTSGQPLWVKRVEKGVDPRDARAVQALLDAALDDGRGWVAAGR